MLAQPASYPLSHLLNPVVIFGVCVKMGTLRISPPTTERQRSYKWVVLIRANKFLCLGSIIRPIKPASLRMKAKHWSTPKAPQVTDVQPEWATPGASECLVWQTASDDLEPAFFSVSLYVKSKLRPHSDSWNLHEVWTGLFATLVLQLAAPPGFGSAMTDGRNAYATRLNNKGMLCQQN